MYITWNVTLENMQVCVLTFEGFTTIMQDEEDDGCGLDQRDEPLTPGTVEQENIAHICDNRNIYWAAKLKNTLYSERHNSVQSMPINDHS